MAKVSFIDRVLALLAGFLGAASTFPTIKQPARFGNPALGTFFESFCRSDAQRMIRSKSSEEDG